MLLNGIFLIILSLVAVPSLLVSKKPEAQEWLDKIVPYQGWFGVISCIYGVWGLIQMIMLLGWLGDGLSGIISWVTWAAYAVVETGLGFILGYALIAEYALKGEAAKAKGEQLLAKLRPLSGKLGILGLIVGVWCIVVAIIW